MFFDNWLGIVRTLIVGTLAYFALVGLLRVSGKRTLSKMNAFDLVVTVALGSTLATILLSEDVALAEGVAAFALLLFLQYAVTWLSLRSALVRRVVKNEPALLVYQGQILEEALRRERVTREEIFQALRSQGQAEVEHVQAVVLETDGTFSVVPSVQDPASSALDFLEGWRRRVT